MITSITELTEEGTFVWTLVSNEGNEKTYQCVDGKLTMFFRHGIALALRLHARNIPDEVYSEMSYRAELKRLEAAIVNQQALSSNSQKVDVPS